MRPALLAAILLAAGLAGGCLRPLYAESTASLTGGSVRQALRGVEVEPIPGLIGHYLRNELVFDLDGESGAPVKSLALKVQVAENLDVVLIDYQTGRADSATLVATANWSVTRRGTTQVVAEGTSVARATYDRSSQRFAVIRAAREAQIRAAKALSELIRNRIAVELVATG